MCGILGGWYSSLPNSYQNTVSAAMNLLRNRGPNAQHYEIFNAPQQSSVVLGHTRLAIIDLSTHANQPMSSRDGRYTLIFNGEIYNYKELRHELVQLGYVFESQSDTEVLLTAWHEWGRACLERLLGMFVFVVYDRQAQTLTCVRDAFGIKPFFYLHNSTEFLFASELPALVELHNKKPNIDLQRSYDYLVHGLYDCQERSFIEGIKHLLPGHMMSFDLTNAQLSTPIAWYHPNISERSDLNFKQATEAVREQFLENIRLHLRSDVPLGASLSGGIDSSAVVCAMRYIEPHSPIHTFSYIAQGTDESEEYWIDRVNQHVNATPHKVVAHHHELMRDLDDMLAAQGEPFGGTSIYAQYRVFQLAKEANVTVVLEGQGADEMLAGYNGYPGQRLLSYLERGKLLASLRFARKWSQWPGRRYIKAWMDLGRILLPDTLYAQSGKLIGRDNEPAWLNTDYFRKQGVWLQETRTSGARSGRGRRVVEKMASSLQGNGLAQLLRHGDRDSMRFSVENRVPFLTLPMANLLLSLPEHYLISDSGQTKHIFRAAMRGIVPDDVLDRRDKIGFATPEKTWMLGMAPTIRTWLEASKEIPILNSSALLSHFDNIVAGKAPFNWQVWRWVNYIKWYEKMMA